jgi:hypothetical protein
LEAAAVARGLVEMRGYIHSSIMYSSMPTTFEQEDTASCFAANCDRPPAYRVLTVTEDGIVGQEQVGGVGVSLLCKECLAKEHSLSDLGESILYGEEGVPGPPDIGILVLPLRLTKSQVAQLREEITEEVPVREPV